MASYLVTGGCGFIGSHLVESLLADGHHVRVVDDLSTGSRDNVPRHCELRVADICQPGVLEDAMKEVDGCFHLAAIASVECSNQRWVETHEVNLTGSIRTFEAARVAKTPVVYASSAAVYGDNADMPLAERAVLRPLTAYGADKLGSELHARVASVVHGVPTTGLRFFNVFGPRQDPKSPYSGVISIFADKVLEQQPLTIYGDGEQTRDFIYVADVVRFLRAAMKDVSVTPEVFNVCRGDALSVNQLATILMSLTGSPVEVNYSPARRGDIRTSIGSPARGAKDLSIVAQTSVTQGLRELLTFLANGSNSQRSAG
ncbi:NAD-dependent epimerase/dehydratase family protein [Enterovibrio makurazakiensis]|uniref:NAD-dependent epimerase/dehydratase family protein n=1 Tax=Enterovibrio gelatinilyticus TaxID=2899819 RepID=A0ABT5R329_9GAMM|nr:NAD-dependent epimerase/dehydratase family protein [Enterovibrio sp. ZSDZ42]MDD1794672.1 NAD-dependent epimerase/dehydratase family protein [Enterovibrio sp. ZSDZ42]